MGKSKETYNKKEREKQRQKAKKDKEDRKKQRQEQSSKGKSLEDMMAYIDENGNISSQPPDPTKRKKEIKAEDIEIGVPKQRPLDPSELIRTGIVTFFDELKGYGFIRDLGNEQSIFVHINECRDRITKSNKVSFEVVMQHKGPSAVNVKLVM